MLPARRAPVVLVMEKAPVAERGGNSAFSGGLFRFAYDDLQDVKPLMPSVSKNEWDRVDVGNYSPDRYMGDLMRVTQSQANVELAQVLTSESYPTMVWMTELGVVWEWTFLWSVDSGERLSFNPGSVLGAKNKGVGLMKYLFAATEEADIDIAYETKMVGFLQDDAGRVTGLRVKTPNGTEDAPASAVVLASGGFEANAEMRAGYLGPGWDRVKVRGTRFNTGETLRMGPGHRRKPSWPLAGMPCHANRRGGQPGGRLEAN